jgi:adenine-specific DNA methylase
VRKDNLIRCANKLVEELEFPIQANNFQFYFLALAYPSELKKVLSDENENAAVNQAFSVVGLIENVLNRFSKKIFKHFMEVPEISVLVQHFLNNNTEDLDNIEGFEPCINMLDEKSKEVISTIVDDPDAFNSNPYLIKQPLAIFQAMRD